MGIDPSKIDLTRYLGPPLRRSFGEHFSDPATVERMVKIYRDRYAVDGCHRCEVFDGVISMLSQLRDSGILLYTATSKPTSVVTPILEEKGLAQYFTFIGGASDDSSIDTKTAVMQHVLARPELNNARVLMVGDRHDDMKGAADCGVPVAGVLYGYGSKQELEPYHPILFAENCQQIVDYVLKD